MCANFQAVKSFKINRFDQKGSYWMIKILKLAYVQIEHLIVKSILYNTNHLIDLYKDIQ